MPKGVNLEIVKAIRKKGYMISNRSFETFAARLVNGLYMEKIFLLETLTYTYQKYIISRNKGENNVATADVNRFKQ